MLLALALNAALLHTPELCRWGMAAVVLAPLYELTGYVVWIVKSIAPPWWAYLVELLSVLLISSLCVVPLLLVLQYLRGDRFSHRYRNG